MRHCVRWSRPFYSETKLRTATAFAEFEREILRERVRAGIAVGGLRNLAPSRPRGYLMLEGTDARIHHIYYTPEMGDARNRGALKTNSFVRLRKLFANGEPSLELNDLGDSEAVLRNKAYMKQTARRLVNRGVIPDEDGWGGWLGRYQAALKKVALEELDRSQQKKVERHRDSGRGQEPAAL